MRKKVKVACIILMVIINAGVFPAFSAGEPASVLLAGAGAAGFIDGKALDSTFNQPRGMAVDKDGGLIIVDSCNNRIRKIKDGQVTTVAGFSDRKDSYGMPAGGYSDGEASKARFNKPTAAVVDSKGNIYVSDTGNNVIRKISGGKVLTFAGTGKAGLINGKASSAEFNTPLGLAIDSGDNIYVADSMNNVIRKITPKGEVTTFAGVASENGGYLDGDVSAALFNEPSDLSFDKTGALYIADSGNQMLRKIDKGIVTTAAGFKAGIAEGTAYIQGGFKNGSAGQARFNFPKGISIADDGTVFIADTWNNRIRALKPDGSVVTVAGNGNPGRKEGLLAVAEFNAPFDVLYYSGTLYISDMWNNCIRAIKADTATLTGVADRAELAEGIDFGAAGSGVKVYLGKKPVIFADVKPFVQNGMAYIPLRSVCEAWGAKVEWDGATQTITISKGSYLKVLDASRKPIFIINGRSVLDTASFTTNLGLRAEWYPEYDAVIIVSE